MFNIFSNRDLSNFLWNQKYYFHPNKSSSKQLGGLNMPDLSQSCRSSRLVWPWSIYWPPYCLRTNGQGPSLGPQLLGPDMALHWLNNCTQINQELYGHGPTLGTPSSVWISALTAWFFIKIVADYGPWLMSENEIHFNTDKMKVWVVKGHFSQIFDRENE